MTNYSRSAYGSNPNAGKERNNAQQRGWGPGWPNCQSSKWVKVTNGDHSVVVRREIATLVATLLKITALMSYDINPRGQVNQTWGAACRAIRGTNTASNHSWALAVDINSLSNPMSTTFKSNIPPAVVHAWEVCGWYWGGRYTKRFDTMHFEFVGTPAQVALYTAKAVAILANLTKTPTKPPAQNPTTGATIHKSRIQNMAKGFRPAAGDPAIQEVIIFLEWCERLTAAGGPAILYEGGSESWQRAIRQGAYDAAGRLLTAAIRNLQERYSPKAGPVDGIFGAKTAAIMAGDGYNIK
jgi:hypothetical protein